MFRLPVLCAAAVWLGLVFLLPEVSSDPRIERADAVRLFEYGWDLTDMSEAAAANLYDRLARDVGDAQADEQARLAYAYGLIHLHRHRHAQAAEAFDEAVRRQPACWDAWRAKIWLEVLRHEDRQAVASAESAVSRLPADISVGPRNDSARDKLREFLGRIFAYLAGPAGARLDPDDLHRSRECVFAQLGGAEREQFRAGWFAVRNLHAERVARIERLAARDLEARTKQVALPDPAPNVPAPTTPLADASTLVNAERYLRDQLGFELALLQELAKSLEYAGGLSMSTLTMAGNPLQTRRTFLQTELADDRLPPIVREAITAESWRLAEVGRMLTAWASQPSFPGAVERQRAVLRQVATVASDEYGRRIAEVQRQRKKQSPQWERESTRDKSSPRQTPVSESAELRQLRAESASLATYVTFRPEEERDRLLESWP